MNSKLANVIRYSVTTLVGAGIAFGVALYCDANYGLFTIKDKKEKFALLSDVFLIPSVLLIGLGLMVVVSDEGFFDLFGFVFSNAFHFFSRARGDRARETYYEYHMRKKREREGRSKWFLVFVGLAFLIPCVVFAILSYK